MREQRPYVEVEFDALVDEERLDEEQIGRPRRLHERLGPLGVSRVGDHFAVARQAQREGRRAARVHDREGRHGERPEDLWRPVAPLDEARPKSALDRGRAGEQHLHRRADSRLHARRAGHGERPCPTLELSVEDQEGHAAEVIAVQVREDHGVDRLRVHAEAPHRDERGGAAVDEHLSAGGLDVDARLEPSATAERIARSENPDLHPRLHPAPASTRHS